MEHPYIKIRPFAAGNFARYLMISALPLKEPIVKYGPFVMNNKSQILEAIEKYKNGTFGT